MKSELTRRCGGVAILWKKDLSAITLPCRKNGRVCAIQISSPVASNITIVGVYMPSDGNTDDYQSCVSTLEEVFKQTSSVQPVVIAGDFNAHIGSLGGPMCKDTPNTQGRALKDLIDRNNLFIWVKKLVDLPTHIAVVISELYTILTVVSSCNLYQ